MKIKIFEFINKFNSWRLKRKIKKVLIKRYIHDYEVELVLEQWIIKRIMDGQTARRKELAEKQSRIKEMEMFINFMQGK